MVIFVKPLWFQQQHLVLPCLTYKVLLTWITWIKEASFKMKSEDLKGELSCSTTQCEFHAPTGSRIYYWPNRKRHTLHSPQEGSLLPQPGGRKIFSSPSNKPCQWEPLQFSQWETITTLNSHYPPTDFLFKTSPPNFLLFLCKVTILSFVCWTCLYFCYSLLVLSYNSLLFLHKPIVGK